MLEKFGTRPFYHEANFRAKSVIPRLGTAADGDYFNRVGF